MPGPLNVSWRHAALGLALGVLLAVGALAALEQVAPASGPAPAPDAPDEGHAMDDDARCAHMPEHCPPGGAR